MASSVWPRGVMGKSRLMSLPGLNELDNFYIAEAGGCTTKLWLLSWQAEQMLGTEAVAAVPLV